MGVGEIFPLIFHIQLGLKINIFALYQEFAEYTSTWRMLLYYSTEFEDLSHQISNNFSNMICRWCVFLICIYRGKKSFFFFFRINMLSFSQLSELANAVRPLLTMYLNKFRSFTFCKVITLKLFWIILFYIYFNFINKFFWGIDGLQVILAVYLSFYFTSIKCEWMLFMKVQVLAHSSPISIYNMLVGILQWEL